MPTQSNVSLTSILTIIQVAVAALSAIPAVGADAALAGVFVKILQNAVTAYNGAAASPLDLTKLPIEPIVP